MGGGQRGGAIGTDKGPQMREKVVVYQVWRPNAKNRASVKRLIRVYTSTGRIVRALTPVRSASPQPDEPPAGAHVRQMTGRGS